MAIGKIDGDYSAAEAVILQRGGYLVLFFDEFDAARPIRLTMLHAIRSAFLRARQDLHPLSMNPLIAR